MYFIVPYCRYISYLSAHPLSIHGFLEWTTTDVHKMSSTARLATHRAMDTQRPSPLAPGSVSLYVQYLTSATMGKLKTKLSSTMIYSMMPVGFSDTRSRMRRTTSPKRRDRIYLLVWSAFFCPGRPITSHAIVGLLALLEWLLIYYYFGTYWTVGFFFIAKRGLILRVQDDRIIQNAMGHQTSHDLKVWI